MPHGDLTYFWLSLGGQAGEPQPTEAGQFSICSDNQGYEFCIWAPEEPA
jgi:hypothetical protein